MFPVFLRPTLACATQANCDMMQAECSNGSSPSPGAC
jgi:hypothetical protein